VEVADTHFCHNLYACNTLNSEIGYGRADPRHSIAGKDSKLRELGGGSGVRVPNARGFKVSLCVRYKDRYQQAENCKNRARNERTPTAERT